MILRAYSIYDRKALQYHPPFYVSADGAAVRHMADAANDMQNMIGRHPNDFVLYYVGDYDDQKGAMLPVSPLVHIIDAMALVQVQRELPIMRSDAHVNGEAG